MKKLSIIKSTAEYISYMTLVFALLFIVVSYFHKEDDEVETTVTNSSIIEFSDELTSIHVEYPKFKDVEMNKIITSIIYTYVKNFKMNEVEKKLDIYYKLYYVNNYLNITFEINNSLDKVKNKNILINLDDKKLTYITSLFDEDYLKNEINDLVYYKYSSDIYDKIKNETVNNFTYIISDDVVDVYFNNIEFNDIDYIPFVSIVINSNTSHNDNYVEGQKYIAFTYDDGPGEYTRDLLKTLEVNKSSATFFMIGNRMKKYESVVKDISNSNSEIGSHTYSHKNLAEITKEEIYKEINSSNILFNELTGKNIELLRPPYGKINSNINDYNLKIILWNIDTKDWLVKDSNKIYNSVISNACDGCIVLMHDIYPETVEATKKIIPKLNEMGYEVVSVSKLLKVKNQNNVINEPISYVK